MKRASVLSEFGFDNINIGLFAAIAFFVTISRPMCLIDKEPDQILPFNDSVLYLHILLDIYFHDHVQVNDTPAHGKIPRSWIDNENMTSMYFQKQNVFYQSAIFVKRSTGVHVLEE